MPLITAALTCLCCRATHRQWISEKGNEGIALQVWASETLTAIHPEKASPLYFNSGKSLQVACPFDSTRAALNKSCCDSVLVTAGNGSSGCVTVSQPAQRQFFWCTINKTRSSYQHLWVETTLQKICTDSALNLIFFLNFSGPPKLAPHHRATTAISA